MNKAPGDVFPEFSDAFKAVASVRSSEDATFYIAGIYRDYARSQGSLVVDRSIHERLVGRMVGQREAHDEEHQGPVRVGRARQHQPADDDTQEQRHEAGQTLQRVLARDGRQRLALRKAEVDRNQDDKDPTPDHPPDQQARLDLPLVVTGHHG